MSNPCIIRDLKKQISNINNFQEIDIHLLDNLHISLERFKYEQGKTKRMSEELREVEEAFLIKAELEFLLYLMETQETVNKSYINQVTRNLGRIIKREFDIDDLSQPA